jgi:hypothetical protein
MNDKPTSSPLLLTARPYRCSAILVYQSSTSISLNDAARVARARPCASIRLGGALGLASGSERTPCDRERSDCTPPKRRNNWQKRKQEETTTTNDYNDDDDKEEQGKERKIFPEKFIDF